MSDTGKVTICKTPDGRSMMNKAEIDEWCGPGNTGPGWYTPDALHIVPGVGTRIVTTTDWQGRSALEQNCPAEVANPSISEPMPMIYEGPVTFEGEVRFSQPLVCDDQWDNVDFLCGTALGTFITTAIMVVIVMVMLRVWR